MIFYFRFCFVLLYLSLLLFFQALEFHNSLCILLPSLCCWLSFWICLLMCNWTVFKNYSIGISLIYYSILLIYISLSSLLNFLHISQFFTQFLLFIRILMYQMFNWSLQPNLADDWNIFSLVFWYPVTVLHFCFNVSCWLCFYLNFSGWFPFLTFKQFRRWYFIKILGTHGSISAHYMCE